MRHVEQWFRMNKSKDLNEFIEAMRMLALPMFNTLYADKVGNLYYVYNALLTIRGSDSYDWSGIIPGTTGRALWRGYFSYDDLPKVINPQSGFLQNCNSTPFLATSGYDNPDINEALSILRNWDLDTDSTNNAMHLAYDAIRPHFDPNKYNYNYSEIMGRLESAVEWSIKHYGTLNVKWGEILRLKRGQTDLPLSGGPDIVRAIY